MRELRATGVWATAIAIFLLVSPLGAEPDGPPPAAGPGAEAAPPAAAEPTPAPEVQPSLGQALREGDLAVSLRYRFEHVDEDARADPADASTLRTSVGYRTLSWSGLSAHIEFSAVTALGGEDRFNNAGAGTLANGATDRPVVADPEITRVNQISGSFENGRTQVTVGRLELALDDQRFVGPVKWRQNAQTFAAAHLESRVLDRTTVTYAFLDRAYTVTGGERPMASHLVHVAVDAGVGEVVGYGYLLDFDEPADSGQSTSTFGVRFSGHRPAGRLKLGYAAAWAHQRERGSNPQRVRAGYYRLEASAGVPKLTAEAGYEVLGGSEEDGRFTTPLATLHAFNGWADRFLATPPRGLEDLFVGVRGAAGPLDWRAMYHDFRADSGSDRYGRELDLLAVYRTPWRQALGVKAAFYDAETFSTDTTKVWVWSAYSF